MKSHIIKLSYHLKVVFSVTTYYACNCICIITWSSTWSGRNDLDVHSILIIKSIHQQVNLDQLLSSDLYMYICILLAWHFLAQLCSHELILYYFNSVCSCIHSYTSLLLMLAVVLMYVPSTPNASSVVIPFHHISV